MFAERERAVLAYCAEPLRMKRRRGRTFSQLQLHVTDAEIVQLSWVQAAEAYVNLRTSLLGLLSNDLASRT